VKANVPLYFDSIGIPASKTVGSDDLGARIQHHVFTRRSFALRAEGLLPEMRQRPRYFRAVDRTNYRAIRAKRQSNCRYAACPTNALGMSASRIVDSPAIEQSTPTELVFRHQQPRGFSLNRRIVIIMVPLENELNIVHEMF
jgi:hypothetical protein